MAKKRPKEPSSFTIRCGPRYRAWLERLLRGPGRQERVTNFVVRLILDYAKLKGIEDPPDRMT